MRHDYSLAHLTVLSLTQAQAVDAAAAAGYRYVGLRLTKVTANDPLCDLVHDRVAMRQTKARLAATGVEVNDVELFRMDPPIEPETLIPILDAAAELGAKNIIAQLPDPNRERAIARFATLCDLAKSLGIYVSLEFPHWMETGDLAAAVEIVRTANRSNAGILVDMLHFDRSQSKIDDLAGLPREWFRFVHVCDAPREWPHTQPGALHTARDERLFPGEGGIDLRSILAHLPQDIPYALEIPRAALTKAVGPEEVARLALLVSRSELDGAPSQDAYRAQPDSVAKSA